MTRCPLHNRSLVRLQPFPGPPLWVCPECQHRLIVALLTERKGQ